MRGCNTPVAFADFRAAFPLPVSTTSLFKLAVRTRHSEETFSGFLLPHYFIGLLSAEAQFCVVTLAKSAGDTYKMEMGLEWDCANLSKVVFREVLLFLQGRLNRNYANNIEYYAGTSTYLCMYAPLIHDV